MTSPSDTNCIFNEDADHPHSVSAEIMPCYSCQASLVDEQSILIEVSC